MYLYERHQKNCQNIHFFIYVRITLKRFQVIFDKSILSKVHLSLIADLLNKDFPVKDMGNRFGEEPLDSWVLQGDKIKLPCSPPPGSRNPWIPGYLP